MDKGISREELITRLQSKFRVGSDNRLMDKLQDFGLVSDESVTIADCADRDLIAAYLAKTI
jgi:hypothetical protein